jgi:beta-mannosidase
MFHIHNVDVGKYVREGQNEIRILFESAILKGRQLNEAFGRVKCWNGETARLFVRKAQYHFGWDCKPHIWLCR